MGQAEVVSHLVRDGGGEANGAVMVILWQKHTRRQPANNRRDLSLQMRRESAALTWFTPPEFSVHMANLLASPTVSPSKSLPLRGRTRRVTTGSLLAGSYLGAPVRVGSRHKLGRVVFAPLQEIGPAP